MRMFAAVPDMASPQLVKIANCDATAAAAVTSHQPRTGNAVITAAASTRTDRG